jgi:hypothetical protein
MENAVHLRDVFSVFSRRPTEVPLKPLTREFRNRVLMLCRDRLNANDGYVGAGSSVQEMFLDVGSRFSYLLGRHRLVNDGHRRDDYEDVFLFLQKCETKHFLDFIEYLFQTEVYQRVAPSGSDPMVDEINQLFDIDDLPYAVTPFVRETTVEEWHGEVTGQSTRTIAHPRVVLREQQITYAEAIEPTINLLTQAEFGTANMEFLAALTDYRKGEYEDCLTKCGSAFESTMKLICTMRGWPYRETDTAAPLLKTIIEKSGLPSYYEQPLLMVAILRNKESSSHGGGPEPRKVDPHVARYAINATAAAILLLVEQVG